MTGDPGRSGRAGNGDGPFGALDPKLNIFALANGMDLVKETSSRRLGWYREGLERGILVEARTDGTLDVTAMCWKTHDMASARRAPQRTGVSAESLVAELSTLLESALEAANCL